MKMIEPKQKQLIQIARTQCGLSDDEYRDILAGQTKGKKRSSKDLTYFEADAVINYFVKTLGFRIKTVGRAPRARRKAARLGISPYSNVVSLPTCFQMEMIDALAGQVTWKLEDGFQRWLAKYIKVSRITTADQASRTIEGLKGLRAHDTSRARSLNAPEG